MNKTQKVVELLAEIEVQQDKAAELRKQLDKSLLLKCLWPSVFDHGSCVTQWKALTHQFGPFPTMRSAVVGGKRIRVAIPEHEGHVLILKRADGEHKEFPANLVPEALGGTLGVLHSPQQGE